MFPLGSNGLKGEMNSQAFPFGFSLLFVDFLMLLLYKLQYFLYVWHLSAVACLAFWVAFTAYI